MYVCMYIYIYILIYTCIYILIYLHNVSQGVGLLIGNSISAEYGSQIDLHFSHIQGTHFLFWKPASTFFTDHLSIAEKKKGVTNLI